METKLWYTSKTLWANAIMALGLVVVAFSGVAISGDEKASIIIVVNLVLRIVSKDALCLK